MGTRNRKCCTETLRRQRTGYFFKIIIVLMDIILIAASPPLQLQPFQKQCNVTYMSSQNFLTIEVNNQKVGACKITGCETTSKFESLYEIIKYSKSDGVLCCLIFLKPDDLPKNVCFKENGTSAYCRNVPEYSSFEFNKLCEIILGGACVIILGLLILLIYICRKNSDTKAESATLQNKYAHLHRKYRDSEENASRKSTSVQRFRGDQITSYSNIMDEDVNTHQGFLCTTETDATVSPHQY